MPAWRFRRSRRSSFLWIVERIATAGDQRFPAEPKNLSQLVPQGAFPSRVHVAEDYDTDIERRWWMSGKEELKDLPPGGRRACRAVLTQDFDDRQGDAQDDVPGGHLQPRSRPADGAEHAALLPLQAARHEHAARAALQPHQRLSPLSVADRPAAGQMGGRHGRHDRRCAGPTAAAARSRPTSGSTTSSSTSTREPSCLIDDVVLYDAAAKDEKRPFPKRILFTGWFDTGKQGKEWPGEFEIVPHEKPRTWKSAKSVPSDASDKPGNWIRVGLRGERRLGNKCELRFAYQLTDEGPIAVELFRKNAVVSGSKHEIKDVAVGKWAETVVQFDFADSSGDKLAADEIRFLALPGKSTLKVDELAAL